MWVSCTEGTAFAQAQTPPTPGDSQPAVALPPVTVVATRPKPRPKPAVARTAAPTSSQTATPAPATVPPQVAGGNGAPEAYGIVLEPEPAYLRPRDTEWAYLVTGFSECIDSFFAFGLFAVAQRSGFFPPELVDTFEPVMQEECRHILLFANWLAAHRRALGPLRRAWFELRVAAVWVFLGWERIGLARGMDGAGEPAKPQDNNFTLTGSKAVSDVDVGAAELMALSLAENDRRFAGYDPRLVRPATMPWLTRLALRLMRRPATTSARART